jgi:hypothetical protein
MCSRGAMPTRRSKPTKRARSSACGRSGRIARARTASTASGLRDVSAARWPDGHAAAERVFHMPGLSFDGFEGYSPIGLAKNAIGLTAGGEQFGASFFGRGTTPPACSKHPKTLKPEARRICASHGRTAVRTLERAPHRDPRRGRWTWKAARDSAKSCAVPRDAEVSGRRDRAPLSRAAAHARRSRERRLVRLRRADVARFRHLHAASVARPVGAGD